MLTSVYDLKHFIILAQVPLYTQYRLVIMQISVIYEKINAARQCWLRIYVERKNPSRIHKSNV